MTFNSSNRSSISPNNKSNVGSHTQPIFQSIKAKAMKTKIDVKGSVSYLKTQKVGVIDLTSNKIAKVGNWTSQTPKATLSLTQDLSKVHSGSVRTTSVKRAETAKKPLAKKEKTETSVAKPAKY